MLKKRKYNFGYNIARKAVKLMPAVADAYSNYNRLREILNHGQNVGTNVRWKYRPEGSQTETKRRKRKAPKRKRYHNDLSGTRFNLIVRKQRLRNASIAKFRIVEQRQQILQGPEGRQAVDELPLLGHRSAFLNTSTSTTNDITGPMAYFDIDPNKLCTDGANIGMGGVPGQMRELNVHSCSCDFSFTNLESAAATCWLYFFIPKNDIDNSPLSVWTSDLDNLDGTLPKGQQNTLTTQTTYGFSGLTPESLGAFPNTQTLKKKYRVMRVRKFELDGGASFQMKFNVIFNRRMSRWNLNQGGAFVKGLTIIPMLIARGCTVGISDSAGATTSSAVTTSPTKIGVVQSRVWKFSVPKEGPMYPVTIQQNAIVAGTTHVYGPRIIDDNDEAVPLKIV